MHELTGRVAAGLRHSAGGEWWRRAHAGDLVVFALDELSLSRPTPFVHDLPGGAPRLSTPAQEASAPPIGRRRR